MVKKIKIRKNQVLWGFLKSPKELDEKKQLNVKIKLYFCSQNWILFN